MDGKTGSLRERWLQRAEAAYRRMFEGKSKEELVTLTQREDMAVLIGRELATFLLEEHVARDPAAQPAEAATTCCPKCGQPGTPAIEEGKELPARAVTTRVGEIGVRRQRWCCAKCRIFFFPLDVRLRLGTEGYSPAVLAKAVRQASKAPSFVEASDDLRELADLEISPTHLQRLSERIGEEWAEVRDEEVEKFRNRKLERSYQEPPRGAAAVMLARRAFADTCRGRGPGCERRELARVEGRVLPDAGDEDPGRGPGAGAAVEVSGADGSGAFGVGNQAAQRAGVGTERRAAQGGKIAAREEEAEERREASALAEAKSNEGPDRRGHDGEQ
jgi:hypothetical protein